jgi:hypothetical protein
LGCALLVACCLLVWLSLDLFYFGFDVSQWAFGMPSFPSSSPAVSAFCHYEVD